MLLLFSFVPLTFAHSHLESSIPADGEVITEDIEKITLTFDGKIEQGSTFELLGPNGQAVSIEELTVNDTEVIGTIANDLENGNYQVVWSIISADGHQMEGEFSFEINVTEAESPSADTNNEEDSVNENGEDGQTNKEENNEQDTEQNATKTEDRTENDVAGGEVENEDSSNPVPVIVFGLIVAIIIFFFVLRRMK